MADYSLELRKSIDDQKKRTAILKPSAKAALEKQYGMTDGGGRAQTTVSNTITSTVPTMRQPAVQRPTVIKPSVQAAQERQYGMTGGGEKHGRR